MQTVKVGNVVYQVVFTTLSARRFAKRGLEQVEIIRCEILDESLESVAYGASIRAQHDTPYPPKGQRLALGRALDMAEAIIDGWDRSVSRQVVRMFYRAVPGATPTALPAIKADDRSNLTNLEIADVVVSYMKMPQPLAQSGTVAPVTPVLIKGNTTGLIKHPVEDAIRERARELGVPLTTPANERLSTQDISRVYRAYQEDATQAKIAATRTDTIREIYRLIATL